ncbi:3-dehydroquinate dehydratase [bacterium BMS3Abin03]|nr:3-dehydroquinate dehydratase [bacterium BMS3Abin03]
MRILIINGPNLNLLGQRDKLHYGELSLKGIEQSIKEQFPSHGFTFFQSNDEGKIIDEIQSAEGEFDALIINPGGYAHSSVAIRDALEILNITKIEVHLSNLAGRENFRQNLITASACDGYISGFREKSYWAAIYLAEKKIHTK